MFGSSLPSRVQCGKLNLSEVMCQVVLCLGSQACEGLLCVGVFLLFVQSEQVLWWKLPHKEKDCFQDSSVNMRPFTFLAASTTMPSAKL